ncbi:MAG: hypothetical protein QOG87_991 [Actinomycetota bacterium]
MTSETADERGAHLAGEPGLPLTTAVEVSGARGDLLRGSAYSIVGLAVAGLGGALFWLIAARLYPSVAVGRASALFTSVLLVNFLSNLGLPVAVARFGHGLAVESDVIFTRALVATSAASAVAAGVFFVVVEPDALVALEGRGTLVAIGFFSVLVIGSSMAILFDVRLMLAREWRFVLVRTALVGVARLPLLWADPPMGDALWLFVLAAGFPAFSGVAGMLALPKLVGARFRLWPRPASMGVFVRFAGVNYLATLAIDAARFVLPVMVLVHVSATANASFYVAWSVTMIAFLVPATIGQVLLVEAARATDRWSHVRAAAALSVGFMGVASLVGWVRADLITSFFGGGYRPAADVLPRLLAAGLPWAVTSVALADARVRGDSRATLAIAVTLALAVLGPAAVVTPSRGIAGAADAWLVGHIATAAIAGAVLFHNRWGEPARGGASIP